MKPKHNNFVIKRRWFVSKEKGKIDDYYIWDKKKDVWISYYSSLLRYLGQEHMEVLLKQ
jgi:hypothetical protein